MQFDLFAQLSPRVRAEYQLAAQAAKLVWPADSPERWDVRELHRRVAGLDRRLAFARTGTELRVRAMSLDALPLAETVAATAPVNVGVGVLPQGYATAARLIAKKFGVDIDTVRVRVGVTRGHLLSLAFSVPLDIALGEVHIQAMLENFVELCLGDALLDQWIASIDFERSARTQSLLRVMDRRSAAQNFCVDELETLVAKAVGAIEAERPPSFCQAPADAWSGLEIPPLEGAPQADRQYASTTCPEALKSALEGLPFDSRRFTAADEILVWLQLARCQGERHARRDGAEAYLIQRAAGRWAVCGTGFGAQSEYFDLWVRRDPQLLVQLGKELADALGCLVRLGAYDVRFGGHVVSFRPGAAPR